MQGAVPSACVSTLPALALGPADRSGSRNALVCAGPTAGAGLPRRIIGDRFASGVKSAILGTLAALLAKAGAALKPFLPQLQTTFLKCLADPVRRPPHPGFAGPGVCCPAALGTHSRSGNAAGQGTQPVMEHLPRTPPAARLRAWHPAA